MMNMKKEVHWDYDGLFNHPLPTPHQGTNNNE
jgi:hypothetical protein